VPTLYRRIGAVFAEPTLTVPHKRRYSPRHGDRPISPQEVRTDLRCSHAVPSEGQPGIEPGHGLANASPDRSTALVARQAWLAVAYCPKRGGAAPRNTDATASQSMC